MIRNSKRIFYDEIHSKIQSVPLEIMDNTIVPYIYQESFNYYYSLWEAQQRNEVKEIEQYKPQIVEITIEKPLRPIKQKKKFIFLDEEGD